MFRKASLCIFIIGFIILIAGCEEKITPKVISDLIFSKGVDHAAVLVNSQFRVLTSEEILILENSIKNGHELSEMESNDTPDSNSSDYLYIDLVKKNKSGLEIYYNLHSNYFLLAKIQVHEEKAKEYKRQFSTYTKYLDGIYKIYASSEINKLLARLKNNK